MKNNCLGSRSKLDRDVRHEGEQGMSQATKKVDIVTAAVMTLENEGKDNHDCSLLYQIIRAPFS